MKEKIAKQVIYWLSVIIVGIALGLGLQFVRAWTEPEANPPGGNVGAPLNTSANTQVKAGSLGINSNGNPVGLMVNGNVGIGTAAPDVKLDVVGGTAQADDFCLQDNSKCLSRAGSGGGGGTITYLNEDQRVVLLWTKPNYCNGSFTTKVIDVSSYVPSTAKKAILQMRCGASMGSARPVGSSIPGDDERIVGCLSQNNGNEATLTTVTLSPDKKFEFLYRSSGCTSWNIVTLYGYIE